MLDLFIIWFLSFIIILFTQINISIFYYNKLSDAVLSNQKIFLDNQYNNILFLNSFLFLTLIKIIIFSLLGYFLESKLKIIQNISFFLERKNITKRITYEYKIFIPLIILELPIILIILFINFNISIFLLSIFLGQFIKLFLIHKDIISNDFPNKENQSLIRNINPNLLSEEVSLNMGQIYSRIILPYLFFILPFLIPLFVKEIFYILPNYGTEIVLNITILSFFSIYIRYLLVKDNFYFSKINFLKFIFIFSKYSLCLIFVILGIILKLNSYLLSFIIILSSFIIPWHPHKLR